jgi:hypothetical protein
MFATQLVPFHLILVGFSSSYKDNWGQRTAYWSEEPGSYTPTAVDPYTYISGCQRSTRMFYVIENKSTRNWPNAPVISAPASCSGCPWFKSWSGDRLTWLGIFCGFLQSFRQTSGYYSKLVGQCFIPLTFSFNIYYSRLNNVSNCRSSWPKQRCFWF